MSRRARRDSAVKGRCMRCRRRVHRGSHDYSQWNAQFRQGAVVGLLCPGCQTAEEYTEAEINLAGFDYSTLRQDAFGRWVANPQTA